MRHFPQLTKGIREMDYILDKKSWAKANGTMQSLKGRNIYVALDVTNANRPFSLVFAFADDEGNFNIYGDKIGFEDNDAHNNSGHSNYYKLAREIKSIMKAGGNIVALGMDKFMTDQITDGLVNFGISRVWIETVRRELRYGFLSSSSGIDMLERKLVCNNVKYCSKSVVSSFGRCLIEQDNHLNRKLVKAEKESDISLAVAAAQCFGMIANDAVSKGETDIKQKDGNINQDATTYIGARNGIAEFTKTSNIVPLTGKYEGYGFYEDGGYFKRDAAGKWHIISELP